LQSKYYKTEVALENLSVDNNQREKEKKDLKNQIAIL
jgi:hypothetical protein